MAFWGYLTVCAAGGIVASVSKGAPVGEAFREGEYWGGLVAGTFLTAVFACITYTLAWRRLRMRLIYAMVTLHGMIMLIRRISPIELLIWVLLSALVVSKFREQIFFEQSEYNRTRCEGTGAFE
jgi:hypothetical protein